eukprot:GHVL01024434.1.p1 GENE.GHVL01024434.1~~GHVL01024434.1.p1  ORF type:complete len:351 (+),score=69.64 GHVL01024434.1:666-1718(+)
MLLRTCFLTLFLNQFSSYSNCKKNSHLLFTMLSFNASNVHGEKNELNNDLISSSDSNAPREEKNELKNALVASLDEFVFDPTRTPSPARKRLVSQSTPTKARRLKSSPSRKSIVAITGLPNNFEEMWNSIKRMRNERNAPVDMMGSEHCGDRAAEPCVYRFQTLVAAFLSSQTKDEATSACMKRLRKYGLTVEHIIESSDEAISKLLYGVGFYNKKTQNLKKICNILKNNYNSDIPDTFDSLVSLPGIGPKMAHIILNCAWNRCEGIAVDIHVHRICNRLGWVYTNNPEKTRFNLESWVPRDIWETFNTLLVGFGQQICRPVKPKCSQCLLQPECPTGCQKDADPIALEF